MSGVPNAWDFKVIVPVIESVSTVSHSLSEAENAYSRNISQFNEKEMLENSSESHWKHIATLDTNQMLKYAIERAIEHKRIQSYVVDTNTHLNESIEICFECCNVKQNCSCCTKPEFGLSLSWTDMARWYNSYHPIAYCSRIPSFLIHSPITGTFMDLVFSRYLFSYYKKQSYIWAAYWIFTLSFLIEILRMYNNPITFTFVCILFYIFFCTFVNIVKSARNRAYDEILKSRPDFTAFTRYVYDLRVLAAGVVCVAAYGIHKFYNLYKSFGVTTESALNPVTPDEVQERLETENPWADLVVEELPVTTKSKTTTFERCVGPISRNLCYMSWIIDGKRSFCDAFFLKSNFMLLPHHMLPSDPDVCVSFVRSEIGSVNSTFKSYCNFKHAVRIGTSDLAVVQVQSGPPFASMIDYLPEGKDALEHVVMEMHRNDIGEIQFDSYRAKHQMTTNNAEGRGLPQFIGSAHTVGKTTFDGRCMSVLVAKAKFPYIHGFHLGGNNANFAVSGALFRQEALDAIKAMEFVLPEASAGTFPTEINGITILTSKEVHPRCATRFLPKGKDNTVAVYGSTLGASTPRSDVVPTIISGAVAAVTGYENKWGRPPFNSRRDHQIALETAANNCVGFPPSALEWAIDDYINPLIARFKELDMDIPPLTEMETINGIPGRRFIDKIVRNTSIGFPRSGQKSKFLIKLDPTETWNDPVKLDEESYVEIERMLECYRRGERAYSPAKTSLKDEPTKLTKKKCRIFYVTNVALQYLVRKYFLAICAAYSTVPLLSNCAVGINRQGPEWEELINYIKEHGDDRIFAGDYSKFDLHMPCQMVRSAFECHIRVAKAFGYSEDDILIMKGLAADLSNPIIAWNGTLLELGSLHMSGNNLTVYNGSIANNLYLRCHYFEQGNSSTPYRDNVNIVTYGDDVIGSVSPRLNNYNHITFRDYLATHGMTFTMPDKESEATKFMHIDSTDFLKCVNRFDPDLGHNVAQLSEDSIFKSLHSVLASKVLSPEEAAAFNIDGAMREWFFHGREKFNLRQKQMKEVVEMCGLSDHVKDFDRSFDARVADWKDKYFPEVKPESGSDEDETYLYEHAKKLIPYKCLAVNQPLGLHCIGESDLLFEGMHGKQGFVIIVEVKTSRCTSVLQKGRRQLKRQCAAFNMLNPKFKYLGVLCSLKGFEVVFSTDYEFFDKLPLPWNEEYSEKVEI
jgi:hypothetical protein